MQITLAYINVEKDTVDLQTLDLRESTCVKDVLLAQTLALTTPFAINGRKATLETRLEDFDRLDIGTPLLIDPKKARLLREENGKTRTKALFARHGGKHQLVK